MISASPEMDSGAALRASTISASRSIRYCSSGAIFGYGAFASCACACHAAAITTTSVKLLNAILPRVFGFIDFLLSQGILLLTRTRWARHAVALRDSLAI